MYETTAQLESMQTKSKHVYRVTNLRLHYHLFIKTGEDECDYRFIGRAWPVLHALMSTNVRDGRGRRAHAACMGNCNIWQSIRPTGGRASVLLSSRVVDPQRERLSFCWVACAPAAAAGNEIRLCDCFKSERL